MCNSGESITESFRRIPPRKTLPDYYEIIKEPVAFSTLKVCHRDPPLTYKSLTSSQHKITTKKYADFGQFVRDVALISHNAQVYNRPSAPVYSDALALREELVKELKKLVDDGAITPEDAELPDLGEIPEAEDSPPPASDEEEEEEDEDEEEEEEGESDDEAPKRRRKRGRPPIHPKEEGTQKTRGRPPKVETPTEKRISNIMKGLRKFKNDDGSLKIGPFEKLPDKAILPGY